MLKDAGIDRLTLASRLTALDPAQRELFSSQYATQWAIVARRVDEARLCESYLFSGGYAQALEDELVSSLPLSQQGVATLGAVPTGPFSQRDDLLQQIEVKSPVAGNRMLASLALLRRGQITAERVSEAAGLFWNGGPLAREAALGLSHWKVHDPAWGDRRLSRDAVFQAGWLALEAIDHPRARPYAALASAWAIEPDRGARSHPSAEQWRALLEPALREGLISSDPDLSFGCALILRDEARLGPVLDSSDPRMSALARRALSAGGGNLVRRRLVTGLDEERLSILRNLPRPWNVDSLLAVLDAFPAANSAFRRDAVGWIRQRRFSELAGEEREAIGRFVDREGATLGGAETFDFVEWASQPRDGHPERDGAAPNIFLEAASARLAEVTADERVAMINEAGYGFRCWLAAECDGDRALIARLLLTPPTLDVTWNALRGLDREHDTVPLRIFLRFWDDLTPAERLSFARIFQHSRDSSPVGDHESFFQGLWSRFRANEDDRLAIGIVLRRARLAYELDEAIKKDLPDWPRGGKDPVGAFRVLVELDPDRVYDAVDSVLPGMQSSLGPALWTEAYRACRPLLSHSTKALPPIGRMVRWFRESMEGRGPLSDEAGPWREMLPAFQSDSRALMAEVSGNPGEDAAWGRMKVAELEEELTGLEGLIADALAREDQRAQQAAEAERRKQEQEQRVRERAEAEAARLRRIEEMRMAREAEVERLRAEREAEINRLRAEREAGTQARTDPASGTSLEHEPMLAGMPLPSLAEYAGFVKKLQRGGNVMDLMAAYGLDAASWSENVKAWSAILTTRPDLAMRFAQLLQQK